MKPIVLIRLTAIMMKSLVAAALVAAALATSPISAASFDQRFADDAAPQASVPPADTPEIWTAVVILSVNGKIVKAVNVDGPFKSSDECKASILANKKLQAAGQAAEKAAVKQFGPTAIVGLACALDLQ